MPAPLLDGRYRFLGKLGEGGMGEVWLVENVAEGRREALKVLHARLAAEPELVSRFRREASATERLRHPNIIRLHGVGRLEDGRLYLAMEHAEGRALDQILVEEHVLPVGRALGILAQLADAIDHAHAAGVVHRDLKPENLVVGPGDVLKVLDFGIAKIIAPDHESVGLTQKGEVFGSACYMAPEQWSGQGRDPRIDIYAFGCIACELVVGRPPFDGRTMELMHAHLTRAPVAPGALRPELGLPPELDALVLRCLEKDPARRFQSGRELLVALNGVPEAGGVPVDEDDDTQTNRRSATNRWLGAAQTMPPLPLQATDPLVLAPPTRAERRALVRELGEALLRLGEAEYALRVGVESVRELEGAADRARVEPQLEEMSAALEQVVGELATAYAHHPEIAQRLRRLRDLPR